MSCLMCLIKYIERDSLSRSSLAVGNDVVELECHLSLIFVPKSFRICFLSFRIPPLESRICFLIFSYPVYSHPASALTLIRSANRYPEMPPMMFPSARPINSPSTPSSWLPTQANGRVNTNRRMKLHWKALNG